MSVNNKRVFYVKYLAHEIYADILRARPDVRLDRLENDSAEEIAAPLESAIRASVSRPRLAPSSCRKIRQNIDWERSATSSLSPQYRSGIDARCPFEGHQAAE